MIYMAGTSVGQIFLDLIINQNDFKKQMSDIKSLAKKTGTVLAAAFSVKKLVDFGEACLELGSDLKEVQNVVDVTFPAMSSQVDAFAREAAASQWAFCLWQPSDRWDGCRRKMPVPYPFTSYY